MRGPSRGWGAVLGLVLVAGSFSAVHPALLIFVPLGFLLVGLAHERPLLVVAGALCASFGFLGEPAGALWYVERGWVLVLGAWFLLAAVAMPDRPFLPRALAALGASAGTVALVLFAARGEWERLDVAFAAEFRESAGQVVSLWSGAGEFGAEISRIAYQAAELQALLYPAMTALASVAGLAVGWWAFRRLLDAERRPLGRLREFRFHNELVWLFIAGLVLLLVPFGDLAQRAGSNVVLFMGALYALRGLAVVLAWIGGMGPLAAVLAGAAALLLYPIMMGATLVIGISDTWFDYRTRHRAAEGASKGER